MADQVYPTVTWSIRQMLGAIRQMPILFSLTVAAVVVLWIFSLATASVPKKLEDWNLKFLLLSVGESALNAVFVTPMIIATHRLVILGEVTKLFSLHVFSWRFAHFLLLSFVFQALMLVVFLPIAIFGYHAIPIIAAIALFFGVVWLASRILIVFPAVATDAPGASLRNAFSDSQGEAGGIFGTVFAIGLLLGLIEIGIKLLLELVAVAGAPTVAGLLLIINQSIFQLVTVMTFAAAASHIYLGLADRLGTAHIRS